MAKRGDDRVITIGDGDASALGTGLRRIIKRASIKVWPKLFQNLRSTRETELAQEWPIHIVCKWLGNSASVAAKHYLQVRPEDFTAAATRPSALKTVQNPVQQTMNAVNGAEVTEDQQREFVTVQADSCGADDEPDWQSSFRESDNVAGRRGASRVQ